MHCPDPQSSLRSVADFKWNISWTSDDTHDSCWITCLGDPTSVMCDEVLERAPCSNLACISCQSYHCDLKLVEHRSRSEDNRRFRGRSVPNRDPCTLANDPFFRSWSMCISRTPSSPSTESPSPGSISSGGCARSPSCHHKLPPSDSRISTDCSDKSSSQLLPPPMQKLSSFHSSFRNLLNDSPNPGCSALVGSFAHLSQHIAASKFVPNDVPPSSGNTIQPNIRGLRENTLLIPSSYSPRPRVRTTTCSGESDTSARDSGLSSHSSSSAYCAPHQASVLRDHPEIPIEDSRPNEGILKLPPPVPPHAPKSHAAAARTVAENTETRHPSVPRGFGLEPTGRLKDVTIRLPRYCRNPCRTVTPFTDKSMLMRPLSSPSGTLNEPTSPIWKRKQRISARSSQPCSGVNETPTQSDVIGQDSCPLVAPSALPKPAITCPACAAAKQYFLCLDALPRLDYVDTSYMGKFNCETCFAITRSVGVNCFNRDPTRSLTFLERHGFLRTSRPDSIAHFILSTPGLCRSQLGAFLGGTQSGVVSPSAVMKCLFHSLDFRESEVDEAIREAVHRFGMPVESQEIGRYLECLAERYHESRWPPEGALCAPVTVNQILLLFYSVLLLQTSLHNESAARTSLGKQTVSMFTKNCLGFLFPESEADAPLDNGEQLELRRAEFSPAKLSSICNRIKMNPLVQGFDHTELVGQIARSLVLPSTTRPTRLDRKWHSFGLDMLTDLVQPYRRLVFYCIMVQFIKRTNSSSRVGLLRHVFLFNDCLLLARPIQSGRKSRKYVFSNQQLGRELVSLLRGESHSRPETLRRLLGTQFRLPCGLRPSSRDQISTNVSVPFPGNIHAHTPLLKISSTSACLPIAKTSYSSRGDVLSCLQLNKLVGVRRIPLSDCVLRPFESEGCRFGLELWSCHDPSEIRQLSGPKVNGASKNPESWRPLITLAALTQPDYENIVYDLIDCFREVHLVSRELAKK
ncbi:hypothetical protein T265_06116 [Opisthorchis viverrini]|uniref:SEC7 domain-containing protein n=1 Tax=Opisthorchis viverrini TaxID=6198 RepID=A0A074ZHG9_OPIVI|nr:hypothetical protein T265_06116 [Opisthorchis viverrini]KER26683.1 hypothetical protein T265_06116 [Opisthorchis viverrini]